MPELQINMNTVIATVSLIASAIAIFKVFFGLANRLTEIEVKVNTMWMFTLRRGQSEAVIDKLMKMNSPLVVTEKAYDIIKPLIPDLRKVYNELKKKKSDIEDTDLAMAIEIELGDRILNEICIPHHLYLGACLVIAVEAAKGTWNGEYTPIESDFTRPCDPC